MCELSWSRCCCVLVGLCCLSCVAVYIYYYCYCWIYAIWHVRLIIVLVLVEVYGYVGLPRAASSWWLWLNHTLEGGWGERVITLSDLFIYATCKDYTLSWFILQSLLQYSSHILPKLLPRIRKQVFLSGNYPTLFEQKSQSTLYNMQCTRSLPRLSLASSAFLPRQTWHFLVSRSIENAPGITMSLLGIPEPW